MSENKSILVGGLAILIGTPFIGVIAWVLWTYWWTNILVWVALIYLLRNYDSNFTMSNKAWWITKRKRGKGMKGNDNPKETKDKSPKPIMLLGELLTEEKYPILYRWARGNPETLEKTVKSLLKKLWRDQKDSLPMCLTNLEMDMEHDHAVTQGE